MLVAIASALGILALVAAAAVGARHARRAVEPELRSLRLRVRELSTRLAAVERSAGSGRIAGAEPVVRPPSRQEERDEPQPEPGSRTVH
jgi:hypothetical protein